MARFHVTKPHFLLKASIKKLLDCSKTSSLIVKPVTTCVMLSVALANGSSLRKLDIDNPFDGTLKEDIYMEQAPCFNKTEVVLHWFANFTKLFMGSNNPQVLGLTSYRISSFQLVLSL